MRVELVSPYEHSPKTGIGRYVHTLQSYLAEHVDVVICRPHFLPLAERFSSLRNVPLGIEDHARGSVVHFPQIMGCAMMLWRPYHPSVATVHDLGVLERPEEWTMLDPLARQILRLSLVGLKKVDLILAVSEFTRQGVIRHLGMSPEQVVTIHSGVDHHLFSPVPNAVDMLLNDHPELRGSTRPWLFYVGSDLPRKNLETLLEAVAILKETYPDLHLLKVGGAGGEHFRQQTVRTISRLNLEETVCFFEHVSDQELTLFYNSVDILVQPSYLEGFGFPILEAMACGTPVVNSDSGALPEIAGGSSVQCSPDNVDDFVGIVRKLLEDRQFSDELGQRGLQNAQKYTWHNAAKKTLAQYRQLASCR